MCDSKEANKKAKEMPNTECTGGATACPAHNPASCSLTVESQTVITNPSDRVRTRIAVGELVQISASGAQGSVNWKVTGKSTLNVDKGSTVILKAYKEADSPVVRAFDSLSCTANINFSVIDCCYPIKNGELQAIFPGAESSLIQKMANAFNESYDKFFVDTCLRKAHFFAQVLQEASSGTPSPETFNYAADRLKRKTALATIPASPGHKAKKFPKSPFKYFRNHPAEADRYGRIPEHDRPITQAADQEAIANIVYANRNGNGDVASGDGWRYRGRGYIQVTGKANYKAVQKEINLRFPGSGIDIVSNPDEMNSVRAGMISAMAFWSMNNLHSRADRGYTGKVVDSITAVVNFHTEREPRRKNFLNAKKAFKIDLCPRKEDEIT